MKFDFFSIRDRYFQVEFVVEFFKASLCEWVEVYYYYRIYSRISCSIFEIMRVNPRSCLVHSAISLYN